MNGNVVIIKWTILMLIPYLLRLCEPRKCIPRNFGEDSTVCVCNATYCDTIGRIRLPRESRFIAYTSSRDGLRFAKFEGSFTYQQTNIADNLIIINSQETQQTIFGWGGAFTDSAGINMKSLNKKARRRLLRSYFSKEGIEYSMCRVPIASCDFSTRFYTYDDVQDDVNLTHFKLTQEDYKYKIPFIKQALQLTNNTLKLIGTAWSSPLWMKTNGKPAGFGFLKQRFYQTWANYHIKFLDAYKRHGIKFWAITTGNEPTSAFFPNFTVSSVGWTPWEQGKWISENLGPTLRKTEYSDLKIIALDDEQVFVIVWLLLETQYYKAASYIDGIGVHWYFNRYFWPQLPVIHIMFPDKFILGTEACTGDFTFTKKLALGDWRRGEMYADDIITDMNQWVTGWLEWNLALNLEGGPCYQQNFVDASILVNAGKQEFYKQTTYYFLGHFSKFVPPSSVKISANTSTELIRVVAFRRPDNGTAIVILNKQNESVQITIHDHRRGYINFNVLNRSINTIVYL